MPKSPQVENGHTEIANEIVEQLAKTNLSPYESRVLWVLFRKTYGWHKHCDHISYTQWTQLTDLKRWHVSRTLSRLQYRLIIIIFRFKGLLYYGFQKDYDMWRPSPEREEYGFQPSPTEVTINNGKLVTQKGDKASPNWVTEVSLKWVTSMSPTEVTAVSPTEVTVPSPTEVNTKENKYTTTITTIGPTNKEKEFLSVLKTLPGWIYQENEDLIWLRDLIKEFPNTDVFNLKSCREYHSDKPAKKGPWKNRLRQWLKHDMEFNKGGKKGSAPFQQTPSTKEELKDWKH